MNDAKLVLAKKKELLEECRRRKKERELHKLESSRSNGYTTKSSMEKETSSKSSGALLAKDFDNLTPDEILKKCGINDLTSSSSTLTPSSSTLSFSSSNNSIYSNVASNSTIQLSSRLKDTTTEIVRKQLEKLNLKPELNLSNKVNIFPNEPIRYDKEIQTLNSVLQSNSNGTNGGRNRHHNKSSNGDLNDTTEDDDASNNGSPTFRDTKFSKKKKKVQGGQKLKPLAFFEEVLVYDTFQWEDEFNPGDIKYKSKQGGETDGIVDDEFSITDKLLLNGEKNVTISNNNNKHELLGETSHDSDIYEDEDIVEAIEHNTDGSPNFANYFDNQEFFKFLREKRPIVERALEQNENNIFFDYTESKDDQKVKEEEENKIAIKFKKRLFAPEKFSNSIVTCLDWSLQHPELILAAYDNMPSNYEESETEAIAALWNVKSEHKLPQQVFTSTSLITACIFSTYQPNLVIAGTFSGQICMWDIRSNKRTPIQRSSLSASSHVNPVYCLRELSSDDSQNLVSISNDGKLCYWSLENLNVPYDSQDLILKHATNRGLYASCMDFQVPMSPFINENNANSDNENSNNLAMAINSNNNNSANASSLQRCAIIGTEDGMAHSFSINNNKFTAIQTFEDHFGPITSINCYSQCSTASSAQIDAKSLSTLSQLFLTSSFDSTIKLWNMTESSKPLYTFECSGDYVYDVAWSPIHPSVFACVDGAGRLDLWNLNKNFETPSAFIEVDNRTRALNKLKWSRKGTEIAVGDDHGEISIYELNESFACPQQSSSTTAAANGGGENDFECFLKTLNTLKKLNQESINFSKSDYNNLNYLMDSFR